MTEQEHWQRQAEHWQSVAARVALANGAFRLLTTPERDALQDAMAVERQRELTREPGWQVRDAIEHGGLDLGAVVGGVRLADVVTLHAEPQEDVQL